MKELTDGIKETKAEVDGDSSDPGIIFRTKILSDRIYLQGLVLILALTIVLAGCGQSGSSSNFPTVPQNTANSQSDKAAGSGQTHGAGGEIPANSGSENTSGVSGHGSAGLPADSMISASQLDQGIKEHKVWQIIDVRETSEFASGHVPGAINIPLGKLEENLSQIAKDKVVVLVDLNGTRSYTAWQKLKEKGYDTNHLKVLVGGMEQWKSLGSGEITESIGGC